MQPSAGRVEGRYGRPPSFSQRPSARTRNARRSRSRDSVRPSRYRSAIHPHAAMAAAVPSFSKRVMTLPFRRRGPWAGCALRAASPGAAEPWMCREMRGGTFTPHDCGLKGVGFASKVLPHEVIPAKQCVGHDDSRGGKARTACRQCTREFHFEHVVAVCKTVRRRIDGIGPKTSDENGPYVAIGMIDYGDRRHMA